MAANNKYISPRTKLTLTSAFTVFWTLIGVFFVFGAIRHTNTETVFTADRAAIENASGLTSAKIELTAAPNPAPPFSTPLQEEQAAEYSRLSAKAKVRLADAADLCTNVFSYLDALPFTEHMDNEICRGESGAHSFSVVDGLPEHFCTYSVNKFTALFFPLTAGKNFRNFIVSDGGIPLSELYIRSLTWLAAAVLFVFLWCFTAAVLIKKFIRYAKALEIQTRTQKHFLGSSVTEIEKRVIFSVFLKKLKRKPILPIISFLLLSLSGGLLCCGAELFRTAAIKSAESDDAFSVILEADAEALQLKSGLTADFAAYKYDYEKTLSAESRYRRLLNLVWDIGDELDYASYDDRRQYAAVGDAISPAASIVLSSESHDPYYDGDLLRAVVSVKCHAVVHNEQAELRDGTADHVYVVWQTEEIIASNKLLGALPEYMVSALILPYDGFSAEINVGASYLLSGCAVFPGYYEYQQEYSAFVPDSNTVPGLFIFTALPQKAAQAETWVYLTDDLSPCIADLGDSDVENFLFGESGEPWLSEIENTKILSNSFYIMTTNSLESTPGFHSGEVQLVSGRSFTPKDYASGAKVCLISFGAAQANGLTVGDTIAVTLYETGYTREYGGETGRNPLFYEWFFADQNYSEALGAEEFQIIGIYSDPGWGRGEGELSVNTVFVPAEALSSYPEMPNSFYGEPRHNNILLVNNSSIDKLLKELEASPVRSFLHLNDNGYLQSRAFISNARIYALILFVLGAAVWLICAVLFVQNYMYGTLRTASSLTALGANPTVSNLAVLLDSALISTLSSLAGFGIGCAAVGVIGELIEKLSRIGVDNLSFAEIEPALSSAPHCGVMLAAAGAAWAILILLSAGGLLKNERCRKN